MTDLTRRKAKEMATMLLGTNAIALIDDAAPTPAQRAQMYVQRDKLAKQIDAMRADHDDAGVRRSEHYYLHLTELLNRKRYCIARRRHVNGIAIVETIGTGFTWQDAFDAALAAEVPCNAP